MQRLKGYWLTKMEAKVLTHLETRKLRSVADMAEYFAVSRASIQKAVRSLRGMELIELEVIKHTNYFRSKHGDDTGSQGEEACCGST
jgi:predicted transcriptional regulator